MIVQPSGTPLKQWQVTEIILDPQQRKRKYPLREIMNAIMYAEWIPLIIFKSRNSPALIEEQYGKKEEYRTATGAKNATVASTALC